MPALGGWLWEARRAWLFLLVVVAAFVSADWVGSCFSVARVDRLRWAGWVLELFGVVSIAVGIWRREARFGKPSWPRRAIDWFARFPLRRRSHNLLVKPVTVQLVANPVRIETWSAPQDDTVEARVASLERNVASLRDSTRRDYARHEKNIGEVRQQVEAERKAREAQEATAAQRVEEALVGDTHLEHVSVFWVLLGLTAATVPELIQLMFWWVYVLLEVPLSCGG